MINDLNEELDDFSNYQEDGAEDSNNSSEIFLRKDDKIFNNRYNSGDGLTSVDDYQFNSKISVSTDYSNSYLKDLYEYEDGLENKFILDEIFEYVYSNEEISSLIKFDDLTKNKIKLTKEQITFIFNNVHNFFDKKANQNSFYNPIYILEVISSISSIEYRKIFDLLDAELQEILILELNKKYLFLEGKVNKKRIH
jgi:hypothetical protein